jgi:hypothetical protein
MLWGVVTGAQPDDFPAYLGPRIALDEVENLFGTQGAQPTGQTDKAQKGGADSASEKANLQASLRGNKNSMAPIAEGGWAPFSQ